MTLFIVIHLTMTVSPIIRLVGLVQMIRNACVKRLMFGLNRVRGLMASNADTPLLRRIYRGGGGGAVPAPLEGVTGRQPEARTGRRFWWRALRWLGGCRGSRPPESSPPSGSGEASSARHARPVRFAWLLLAFAALGATAEARADVLVSNIGQINTGHLNQSLSSPK